MVELSKLPDEENGNIITEWVTILSSPWYVEMKPFHVMWHQVALRKNPWTFGEITFVNIPVRKINCININQKWLYRVWEQGRSKCENLHSLSQTISYPHYWQLTLQGEVLLMGYRRSWSCNFFFVVQKNNLKGLSLFSTLSFSMDLFSVDLLLGFLTAKS